VSFACIVRNNISAVGQHIVTRGGAAAAGDGDDCTCNVDDTALTSFVTVVIREMKLASHVMCKSNTSTDTSPPPETVTMMHPPGCSEVTRLQSAMLDESNTHDS
jgi:hypothetical protein